MPQLISTGFNELVLGQQAQFERRLNAETIHLFAVVSGDVNPVHLDAEYAAETVFGEPIGHGMWLGALVSAAIATQLPGPGSVYRAQQLQFKQPVKVGDTAVVTLTVKELKARIRLVVLDCEVHNQDGKLLARGEADVIAPAESGAVAAPELPKVQLL
ncbi:MaoC/PaaZ C-terminal domain-containing protein [Gilvimarinus polysaccharolyticus]|uniref:MaoC/PaaZ C-terminal domain-containing protein n=1 Tax=Gilvimarinus polysaccharolyticus TaxID=863921 RepID=UPI0006734E1D|nr:MaoC/PaaZ C-terminal domain-containing protein [Gilvimarinus polysaccharolyticus]